MSTKNFFIVFNTSLFFTFEIAFWSINSTKTNFFSINLYSISINDNGISFDDILFVVDKFSSIKNVGRIRTGGLRELSIRVWIDPIKLAANNLTIQDVESSLRNENVRLPAGTLEANNIDLTINIDKYQQFLNLMLFYSVH